MKQARKEGIFCLFFMFSCFFFMSVFVGCSSCGFVVFVFHTIFFVLFLLS